MKLGLRFTATLGLGLIYLLSNCSTKDRDFQAVGSAGAPGDSDGGTSSDQGGEPSTELSGAGGSGGSQTSLGGEAGTPGNAEGGSPTQICVPDEPACDGNKATSCNSDGTGYLPGGVKCSSTQTCLAGACENVECTPSARFCSGATVRQCADNGLSSEEVAPCASGEYCDSESASCKTGVCAPNAPACNGAVATQCNASGSGYVAGGTACDGQTTCEAGQCVPWVCPKPGESYCQAQSVKSCAANGLSSEILSTCVDQTCVATAGVASCKGECAPSQKKCSGNNLQSCGADGNYAAGTACGADKTCLGAVGQASCGGECGPNQKRCLNNGVQSCSATGTYGAAVACNSNTLFCSAGVCAAPPSCPGLSATCGKTGNENCCTSLRVDGGTYKRFNNDEAPATLSTFRLDKFEVTVGRFRKFVDAVVGGWLPSASSGKHSHLNGGAGLVVEGGNEPGWDTAWNTYLPATKAAWDGASGLACLASYQTWTPSSGANEERPINCVSTYQAQAFCIWDGGFLPSENEWNYAAAGGSEQRVFPWGGTGPSTNALLAIYGCYYNGTGTCSGVTNIAPVGSVALGNGLFQQSDLGGNVWEWVLDWWSAGVVADCTDCANTTSSSGRIIAGGSFANDVTFLRNDGRSQYQADRDVKIGFRCARAP